MREIHPADATLLRLLQKQKLREGARYKRSQFTLALTEQGETYLLNTFTRQWISCDAVPEGPYSAQEIAQDPVLRAWMEGYTLVPEDRDEAAFYESSFQLMSKLSRAQQQPTVYTILPTLGCNARCVYCFEEGMKPQRMTEETAAATARFIAGQSRGEQEIVLSWFGGEPLLEPGVIDRVCGDLAAQGLRFRSGMVSNGSLITDELIERMLGPWRLGSIQLSMDGDEQSYIRRKQYPRYSDEYHRVIAAAGKLAGRGLRVHVRCNVDAENVRGAAALIRDLEAAVANKARVSISIAMLSQARLREDDLAVWQEIFALWDKVCQAGFMLHHFPGVHLRFRRNFCTADGGGVVIAPDGRLYPCDHLQEESCFGDVVHGITRPQAREDFARHGSAREQCRACPFLPDCTAFQSCPVRDRHCRQMRELLYAAVLRQRINRQTEEENTADAVVC